MLHSETHNISTYQNLASIKPKLNSCQPSHSHNHKHMYTSLHMHIYIQININPILPTTKDGIGQGRKPPTSWSLVEVVEDL